MYTNVPTHGLVSLIERETNKRLFKICLNRIVFMGVCALFFECQMDCFPSLDLVYLIQLYSRSWSNSLTLDALKDCSLLSLDRIVR